MVHEVLLNKAATIERCIARAREEYAAAGPSFSTDFTRQDAAVLNIQRACEAALDMDQHVIRNHRLGLPQSARDVFDVLAAAGWIRTELAESLKKWWVFATSRCMTTSACCCPLPSASSPVIWMNFCATANSCCKAKLLEFATKLIAARVGVYWAIGRLGLYKGLSQAFAEPSACRCTQWP